MIFTILLALVQVGWQPLLTLDTTVARLLNAYVSERDLLVDVLGVLAALGGSPTSCCS